MWAKSYPLQNPKAYPPASPKWHWVKEVIKHPDTGGNYVVCACGLKMPLSLMAKSDMQDNKPSSALLCKHCKKAFGNG